MVARRLRGVRRLRASLAGHNAYACDVRAATLLELASAPTGAEIVATDCGRGSADRFAAENSLPHRFFVRAPRQVRLERRRWDIGYAVHQTSPDLVISPLRAVGSYY
jgi:hypothetical protein